MRLHPVGVCSTAHSHLVPVLSLSLTPSVPIFLQSGLVGLIMDLVHNHCLLAI